MRLTEEQIEQLRPKWNEYPERRVLVPVYPPARRKRGLKPDEQAAITEPKELGALPAGGLTGGPSVKLWSVFFYGDAANAFMQAGSDRYSGPVLLHSFTGQIDVTAQGTTYDPLQITYSESPIPAIRNGASRATVPGTPIADLMVQQNTIIPAPTMRTGLQFERDFGNNIMTIPIGLYIPLDSVYFGIGCWTLATVAFIYGTFRIIEHAPPESISWM